MGQGAGRQAAGQTHQDKSKGDSIPREWMERMQKKGFLSMVTPSDSYQSANTPGVAEKSMGMMRLFNFDLPVIKKTGKVFPEVSDLSTIHRVLDVACGSGEWVITTAQMCPTMQVVGIDSNVQLIDSAQARAKAEGVVNASFIRMDPLQPLDFSDGSFDLVNVRFVASFVPKESWPMLFHECLRATRRDGIIRLTETDMPISNSRAFEQFNGMIARALFLANQSFSPDGVNLAITPMLRRLLQQAGCRDIQSATAAINFSAGMQEHVDLVQDLAKSYQLVQPFLIEAKTQDEVTQTYQQMLAEMQAESFCAVGFYLVVWSTKP